MIRDWDLWPIYLDQGWVDAESAKRFAEMSRRLAEIVRAAGTSAVAASEAWERVTAALHAPATRR